MKVIDFTSTDGPSDFACSHETISYASFKFPCVASKADLSNMVDIALN